MVKRRKLRKELTSTMAERSKRHSTTHADIDLVGLKHHVQLRDQRLPNAVCEGIYREEKEDKLNKEFNVTDMGEINKQCDAVPIVFSIFV